MVVFELKSYQYARLLEDVLEFLSEHMLYRDANHALAAIRLQHRIMITLRATNGSGKC